MTAEVVELYKHNYRDPVATLREIADQIESGAYKDVQTVAIVIVAHDEENSSKDRIVLGMGPESSDLQCYAAMTRGADDLLEMSHPRLTIE
jgi:hypothetical protein